MSRAISKYGNIKTTTLSGHSFASKLEREVFQMLSLMQVAEEIRDLRCQHHVSLSDADIKMIPDFSCFHVKLDTTVYVEAKGLETDVYRIKRRLWMVYGPGPLLVWKRGTGGGIYEAERIFPKWRLFK